MKDLKINRGIELMLRGERPKVKENQDKGFSISKFFSLLKRKVYFNLELRWSKEDQ
jgi:hypothetical protein